VDSRHDGNATKPNSFGPDCWSLGTFVRPDAHLNYFPGESSFIGPKKCWALPLRNVLSEHEWEDLLSLFALTVQLTLREHVAFCQYSLLDGVGGVDLTKLAE
jgi:hypothetical protein